MTRRHISKAARARLYEAAGGRCCLCGTRIAAGSPWIREHVLALHLNGADDETNWAPAHVACAAAKTKREAQMRGKVRRLRAGGRKRKGRPLAGTIASGLRKRMDGTVERR
jgi:5-methylcytosine-specific restriction endonuclease McrA